MIRNNTYGIEQVDGSIKYNVYPDKVFTDAILNQFIMGKRVKIYDPSYIATSIEDYYSDERYKTDESKIRGFLRKDGILEYRYYGDKNGIFTYMRK
jgi:phosphatidylserine/phosphatidylglycerophosphate/cardiolipin synthase-like enzyme